MAVIAIIQYQWHRARSGGADYGDRFVPARRSSEMEIAYSLMEDGDDDAFSQCTSPFGSRRGPLFSFSAASPSSSSLGRFAPVGMATVSSSSLLSAAAGEGSSSDMPGTAAAPGSTADGWRAATAAGGDVPAVGEDNVGAPSGAGEVGGREKRTILNTLLKNELLGVEQQIHSPSSFQRNYAAESDLEGIGGGRRGGGGGSTVCWSAAAEGGAGAIPAAAMPPRGPLASRSAPALLAFKTPRERHSEDMDVLRSFSLLPVGATSRRLLATPPKTKRKIAKVGVGFLWLSSTYVA